MSKDTGSVYSQEGTIAHELSDLMLQVRWKGLSGKGYSAEKRKLVTKLRKLFPKDHEVVLTEMETEVGKYVDIVSEAYTASLSETPDAVLLLEERLDYSHVVPQGFGTGDAIIIGNSLMKGFDLKYGKGIVVDAKLNSQQMLYSLGALRKYEMQYDIERVQMNIVQPRINNFSTWETSTNYITSWGEKVVRQKAIDAYEGKGEKKAGEWCKWCKVKPICRAAMDHAVELAKHDFRDPDLVSIQELSEVLDRADMFTDWLSAVKQYLTDSLMSGEEVPGYKLVEGRATRKWVDEEKAKEILAKKGFKQDQYLKTALEGITTIEKLVGKDGFEELLSGTFIKPQGAPTMVHVSDKRPGMGLAQAREDFSA
jgi:hypothetical protein